MKTKILLIVSCVFLVQMSNAQEAITHNIYTVNPLIFNPAATDAEGNTYAFLDAFNQWASFHNAPLVSTFGIQGPITNKMSLGLIIYNDDRSILNHTSGLINYAYKVKINEDMSFTAGIALGLVNNRINFSNINPADPNDPLYNTTAYNTTSFAAGAGLKFKYKTLEIHFSLPQMIEQGASYLGQYNFLVMYGINATKQLIIKPSVMFQTFPENIMQEDINVMADWKKMFWVQLGYRTDESILASFGIKVFGIGIGYCFQSIMGNEKYLSPSSHEIILSYTFKKKVDK